MDANIVTSKDKVSEYEVFKLKVENSPVNAENMSS